MHPITILIADDHRLVRDTWQLILGRENRFSVIAQCSNGEEAIRMAKELRPAIALLDINMSPVDGFEATSQIRRFSPGTRIITVSMFSQPTYVKKMFRLGALGYVSKNSSPGELIDAILTVNDGKRFVCDEIQSILTTHALLDEEPAVNSLTARELEIMKYIRDGCSSKEIGAALGISSKTIEVHRHKILTKLHLSSSIELVNFINTSGIVF